MTASDARKSLSAEIELLTSLASAIPPAVDQGDGDPTAEIFAGWRDDIDAYQTINDELIKASDDDLKTRLDIELSLLSQFKEVADSGGQSEIYLSWSAAFENRISVIKKLKGAIEQ